MTIYIDIVLIENVIMNYIILVATKTIIKAKLNILRLLIASLLGAIYSIVAYMSILEIYSSIVLKIILSIIMVYISFNAQSVKKLWKELLIFYLVSFVFGGAAFSLIYIIKPQNIIMKNGLFLGTYALKTLILGTIISFALIVLVFRVLRSKLSKKDMLCDIEIKLNNKIIKTKAMIDTGNMLKEPITNVPVVVIEHTILYEYMEKEILNNIDKILGGDFTNIPEKIKNKYIFRLKVIPFASLGKQNGMLLGIKPEFVKVLKEGVVEKNKEAIIGIYNKSLTKKGEYRALIGLELL